MRAHARCFALIALLTNVPLAASQGGGSAPADAPRPEAEGGWILAYAVPRDRAGRAALALDVLREDEGDVARGRRDLGARDLAAGRNRVEVHFLAAEGPGDYAVALVVDGAVGSPARFTVRAGAGASGEVSFHVEDRPTRWTLANDSVNADGKLKLPGEEVVTRAFVEDANGWGDLDGLAHVIARADDGRPIASALLPVEAAPGETRVAVESRFARAPLAAGAYTLTLHALKGGASVASVTRTFVVKEVAPSLAPVDAGSLAAGDELAREFVLLDRNGHPDLREVELRALRGSARAEAHGFLAEAGAAVPLPDADGQGRLLTPVIVRTSPTTPHGAYRVSAYVDGALVGSLAVTVRAAPVLHDVRKEEGALVARGEGDGVLTVTGANSRVVVAFTNGTARVPFTESSWNATLSAREGGRPLAWRTGGASPVGLEPVGAAYRLRWRVTDPALEDVNATARLAVTRWDGVAVDGFRAVVQGRDLRLDAPPGLPAGRYAARLVLETGDLVREAEWTFEAGRVQRLALRALPSVEGAAALAVVNEGNAPLRRLLVETDPRVERVLLAGVDAVPLAPGRFAARGLDVPPGGEVQVTVALPAAMPAGAHRFDVRVFAGLEGVA